jgi:CHAT domain-containing protein
LGRLPFAALPTDDNDFLLSQTALSVVPVPQLLSSGQPVAVRPANTTQSADLLLVGAVNYDVAKPISSESFSSQTKSDDSKRTVAGTSFLPLDGAAKEIASIEQIHKHVLKQHRATPLTGVSATVAKFNFEAPRHKYLHLATHGFFDPNYSLSDRHFPLTGANSLPRQSVSSMDFRRFHPGLFSGLALAGANALGQQGNAASGYDDGILTADEVSMLDLSAVDLAVLSACQSGLGEVAGGEGLLGLQRAFQVAGAKSVIASLWSVSSGPFHAS